MLARVPIISAYDPSRESILAHATPSYKITRMITELSVEFCVDEVMKDRGGFDIRRRRRCKSSSLGMPKAPQVNIQGYYSD